MRKQTIHSVEPDRNPLAALFKKIKSPKQALFSVLLNFRNRFQYIAIYNRLAYNITALSNENRNINFDLYDVVFLRRYYLTVVQVFN